MLTKRQWLKKTAKRLRNRLAGQRGQAGPVFIFGSQRSGTNMLIGVIERCTYTECYRENDDEAFDDYRLKDIQTVRHLVDRSYARSVVFKPICDSQNARSLLNDFPDAKAVWMYRCYQDCVNSALRQFREHQEYLEDVLAGPERGGWPAENVVPEDIELVRQARGRGVSDASARSLMWYLRNVLYFQLGLDSEPRVYLASYDDLIREPTVTFLHLFEFLDLPYEDGLIGAVFDTSIGKHPFGLIDPETGDLVEKLYARLEEHKTCWL